jgi:hypothetical protein
MPRIRFGSRLAVLLVALLTVFAFLSPVVSAQQEIDFRIFNYTCPLDPGNVSVNAGNIPADCTPTSGVSFSVTAADGTAIGTCTTDANGVCILQVPNESTVTVTEDESTGPAGYVPRENPITTQAVTEFAGALFINIPAAAPQPTAVPSLPGTGTGPSDGAPPIGLWLIALLAASLLTGSLVTRLRREPTDPRCCADDTSGLPGDPAPPASRLGS